MKKYPVRYMLSLFLLIILVILVYVAVRFDESSQVRYVQTVNIIGRQRMLSQRMTNFSNRLLACERLSCDPKTKAQLIGGIQAARNLFQPSFMALISGTQNGRGLIKIDQEIYDTANINRQEFNTHIQRFLRVIDGITSPDPAARRLAATKLNQFSESLLTKINSLVDAYAAKADDSAQRVMLLQYIILLLLVGAIFLNGLMVFRPLERELRKSYADLEKQKNFMQSVIGFMPDPLLIVNADGEILVTNKATEKIFGWSEKQLLKMNFSQLLDPEARAGHGKMIRNFVENSDIDNVQGIIQGMIQARTVKGVTRSGEEVKISVSLARYAAPDSNLAIAVIRDISLLESINEALEDRIAATRIARESKERFIRNISHELRTPLNAVIGFSDLLKNSLKNSEEQGYANNINSAGEQLLADINQLIDVAALKSEKKKFSITRVDLAECIGKMKDVWSEQLARNSHHLVVEEIAPDVMVNMDLDIFSYIVKSILDNVIVHCAKGRAVRIYLEQEEDGPCLVIEDDGDGVSADHLLLIGTAFETQGTGLTAQKGGLALSLFLAVQQMKAIGGRASFYSEPGKGFTVRLSLQRAGQ